MAMLKHEASLGPGVWRQVFFLLCLARRQGVLLEADIVSMPLSTPN